MNTGKMLIMQRVIQSKKGVRKQQPSVPFNNWPLSLNSQTIMDEFNVPRKTTGGGGQRRTEPKGVITHSST